MTSTIYLKDLVVEAKHGVHAHEKVNAQRFSITLDLEVNTPEAFVNDDINNTVSYSWLRQTIINIVQQNSFDLIERLAQVILDGIFVDSRIQQATLSIEKLDVYPDTVPGIRVIQTRN